MSNAIIKHSQEYISKLLTEKLTEDFRYHDLQHTLSVKEWCNRIGKSCHVSDEEQEILDLAALFHDTGFTQVYEGHEEVSKAIARKFLEQHSYPKSAIVQVENCINATKMEAEPNSKLESILKDADLNSLGTEAFLVNSENLRHEWDVLCNAQYSDVEWLQNNLDFLEQHFYYTDEAQQLLGDGKKNNLKKIKKMLKKEQKEKKEKEKAKAAKQISGSRSAQMMFKTSLRNHIDLTNIADNKANIMLSLNTLLIGGIMTYGINILQDNPLIGPPIVILLVTSLLCIIFATMATRPIKMNGFSTVENIREGKANLFFFGNFYKMKLPEYTEGISSIVEREEILEKTIISDLYFLGKALGEKYNKLRMCYLIFMVGVTLAVAAFGVSYFVMGHAS